MMSRVENFHKVSNIKGWTYQQLKYEQSKKIERCWKKILNGRLFGLMQLCISNKSGLQRESSYTAYVLTL